MRVDGGTTVGARPGAGGGGVVCWTNEKLNGPETRSVGAG